MLDLWEGWVCGFRKPGLINFDESAKYKADNQGDFYL